MKKFLSLILALLFLLSCMVGCGSSKTPAQPEETTAPAEDVSDPQAVGPYLQAFNDAFAKYPADTVVMVIDGEEITWQQYFSWIYSALLQASNYMDISDMNAEIAEGFTLGDYVREYTEGMSSQYAVINARAKALGLELTPEQEAQIEEIKQADADEYYGGDVATMMDYLTRMYVSEDLYHYMTASSLLYQNLFNYYLGENGEDISEEDVISYAEGTGIMHAKHILFKTVDDSNQPFDEAAKAEKLAEAEKALAQLKAVPADELDAKFSAMAEELTEDPGSLRYPDGYYFTTGQFVPVFEETTKALEPNQLSEIVESNYGYHIIYRPEMHADDVYSFSSADGSPVSLRAIAADGIFSVIAGEWAQSMDLKYVNDFDKLDLTTLVDLAPIETVVTE